MVVSFLAASASAWGVLMGLSPVLQIRRMLRQRSSREVSLGYFAICWPASCSGSPTG